jgi:hypothetical protein
VSYQRDVRRACVRVYPEVPRPSRWMGVRSSQAMSCLAMASIVLSMNSAHGKTGSPVHARTHLPCQLTSKRASERPIVATDSRVPDGLLRTTKSLSSRSTPSRSNSGTGRSVHGGLHMHMHV